ncbi:MAG: SIR2 family protein [Chloroflexota bacterium]|nr:SIR2 family protein [Chloroflexota bacterium]
MHDAFAWLKDPSNETSVRRIREQVEADRAGVLIFLGAGLSYGAARARRLFELTSNDNDHAALPSWPVLITRMLEELKRLPDLHGSIVDLEAFKAEQSALDFAELFRGKMGEANYVAFLRQQFAPEIVTTDVLPSGHRDRSRMAYLTASHRALVALPVESTYTTNFDELIETAYRVFDPEHGLRLRVSAAPAEFMANVATHPPRHLIKLHGTIDRPDTIVLTRSDFARSRRERAEMFSYFAHHLREASFVFVGFSLSDPNFTQVYDDARLAWGSAMPVSYIVQAGRNVVKEAYLRTMGLNTIALQYWDELPEFLHRINPQQDWDEPLLG